MYNKYQTGLVLSPSLWTHVAIAIYLKSQDPIFNERHQNVFSLSKILTRGAPKYLQARMCIYHDVCACTRARARVSACACT